MILRNSTFIPMLQYGPTQPGVLGSNSYHRGPVAPALLDLDRSAAHRVGLVFSCFQNGLCAQDQQGTQLRITSLGDAPQALFAARAVLARQQTHLCTELLATG